MRNVAFSNNHYYITYAMDFRFVPSDPACLTSCHILISKQHSTIRALGSNRYVTGRRSRDENPAVTFRQSAKNRSRARDTQPNLQGGASVGTPGSWKIWEEEVLSLSICLSTHLSHTTETSTRSRIKCERYIFLKRSVFVRSLKFVNYV